MSVTIPLLRLAAVWLTVTIVFSSLPVSAHSDVDVDPEPDVEEEDVRQVPPPAVIYSPAFLDVAEDSLFADEIRSLAASGVTRGCDSGGTRYCAQDPVTRGQMAAFLVRAFQLEPGSTGFSDTVDSVFAADIAALAASGITVGCDPPANTKFCPEQPITRGQMAAFLTRALDLAPSENSFVDAADHLFASEIGALAAEGITRGCEPGGEARSGPRFCPDGLVTRGEMAAFLLRSALQPVPAVPDGVAFQRFELDASHQTSVEVCADDGRVVTVVHAAEGSVAYVEAERADVIVTDGEYDPDRDVWVVEGADGCAYLLASWLVGPPDFDMPLVGYRITSRFGIRIHPIRGERHLHTGVDLAAPTGTPVLASAPGRVEAAGVEGRYGRSVVIAHQNGYITRYAHLSEVAVAEGEAVAPGDLVGAVGCTGSCTGPHLHFEIRKDGVALDPLDHLVR